jgi:hypothetical protein
MSADWVECICCGVVAAGVSVGSCVCSAFRRARRVSRIALWCPSSATAAASLAATSSPSLARLVARRALLNGFVPGGFGLVPFGCLSVGAPRNWSIREIFASFLLPGSVSESAIAMGGGSGV